MNSERRIIDLHWSRRSEFIFSRIIALQAPLHSITQIKSFPEKKKKKCINSPASSPSSSISHSNHPDTKFDTRWRAALYDYITKEEGGITFYGRRIRHKICRRRHFFSRRESNPFKHGRLLRNESANSEYVSSFSFCRRRLQKNEN